jgi:hypothetical protein
VGRKRVWRLGDPRDGALDLVGQVGAEPGASCIVPIDGALDVLGPVRSARAWTMMPPCRKLAAGPWCRQRPRERHASRHRRDRLLHTPR